MLLVKRPLFITPHAIEQFQRRVASWPAGAVIDWLLPRLQTLPNEVDFKDESLLYVLFFGGRRITAVVGPGEGEWPAVLTVIGDTERVDRLMGWRGRKWSSKDSHRLEALRWWGFDQCECAAIMDKPVADIEKRWSCSGAVGT